MASGLLAMSLVGLWSQWIWPLAMFIIGLGLVVFVHELGHFIVAKLVDIRVDRFALGFGPKILGFRRGETEYCLCLLPLGGYIAMAGQEDFKPDTDASLDPRSFKNKSVGARLAVVSAGVVMNVIFGAILFVIVSLIGLKSAAPVVGDVVPGYPASQAKITWNEDAQSTASKLAETAPTATGSTAAATSATTAAETPDSQAVGLRPGDKILRIDSDSFILNLVGHNITRFADIATVALLADPGDRFAMTIERQEDGRTRIGQADIGVKRLADGTRLGFGIEGAPDIVIGRSDEMRVSLDGFEDGDRLVSVDGRRVEHFWDLKPILESLTGEPVDVVVDRGGKQVHVAAKPGLGMKHEFLWLADGKRLAIDSAQADPEKQQIVATLPDGQHRTLKDAEVVGGLYETLDIVGLLPRVRVGAVIADSRADQAGLKPGDIIVGYADRPIPTPREIHSINERVQDSGTNMALLRDGQVKTMWIVPKSRGDRAQIGIVMAADLDHLVVSGVREGSPAAQAGIPADARILAVNGTPVATWRELLEAMTAAAGQPVVLKYQLGEQEKTANLDVLTPEQYDPEDYQYTLFEDPMFRPLTVRISESNPIKAISWGTRETAKFVLTTYLSLRSLFQGTVSVKELHGPVGIGGLAVQVGRKSVVDLVYFMAFISAVVAVMNFLPLPVMDGGIAVLLLIEKIRRKPLPNKVMVGIQIAGWVLLLGLFVALTWNDIVRLLGQRW